MFNRTKFSLEEGTEGLLAAMEKESATFTLNKEYYRNIIIEKYLKIPNLKLPQTFIVSSRVKQAIFDEIMLIVDISACEQALRDASGIGDKGENHPVFQIMKQKQSNYIPLDFEVFGLIKQALASIHIAKQLPYTIEGLRIAVQNSDVDYVKNCNADLFNDADKDGVTLLMLACKTNSKAMVEILLGKTNNVNKVTKHRGLTALYIATANEKIDSVAVLLKHGADVDKVCKDDGKTALHIAIEKGNIAIVKILLEYNADINKAKTERSYMFIDNGPVATVSSRIPRTLSPLEAAINLDKIDIAKLLIATSGIIIPPTLSVTAKLQQSIYDDLMSIKDLTQRQNAMRDAIGKGRLGEEHPVYKIMRRSPGFIDKNPHIENITKALTRLEQHEKGVCEAIEAYSTTAIVMSAIVPDNILPPTTPAPAETSTSYTVISTDADFDALNNLPAPPTSLPPSYAEAQRAKQVRQYS